VSAVTKAMTAVLLAGGKARRMGQDKRFLEIGGRTFLERAISVLEPLFAEVLLVVATPDARFASERCRVVTDLVPERAAVGGVFTGLSLASHPAVFVAACDMPLLNPALIERMAGLEPEADIVMAKLATGLQPMHARYGRACLPHVERMVHSGTLKLQELVNERSLRVRLMEEAEFQNIELLSFMNVNTPADLELVRKLIAGQQEGTGLGGTARR
jgi:molybdopterin-guanine dinucleotide biosynthesis protein A